MLTRQRACAQATESRVAGIYTACEDAEKQTSLKSVRRQVALLAASLTYLAEKMSMRPVRVMPMQEER